MKNICLLFFWFFLTCCKNQNKRITPPAKIRDTVFLEADNKGWGYPESTSWDTLNKMIYDSVTFCENQIEAKYKELLRLTSGEKKRIIKDEKTAWDNYYRKRTEIERLYDERLRFGMSFLYTDHEVFFYNLLIPKIKDLNIWISTAKER